MNYREYKYSDKAEKFRKEVQEWIKENIPAGMEFPPETEELDPKTYAFAKTLRVKLAAKGWIQPTWPKEYGGAGLSTEEAFALDEELWHYGVPRVYDLSRLLGAALLTAGTEQQKKRFLPMIARGEIVVWQAFTEPNAGSDLAALQLQATPDKDGFLLNGQKTYIGEGHPLDYLYTLAVTNPKAPRHQNMSAFMVKADTPGITMTSLKPIALSRKNTIYFENVRVPPENLIGELNNGWNVSNFSLLAERGGWGTWFRLSELFEEFLKYCKETKRNGVPLIDAPDIREQLVTMYFDVKGWELAAWRRKWRQVRKLPITYEGTQQSLWIKSILPRLATSILDITGPLALISDPKWAVLKGWIEHFERASLMTHGAGTPEILRLVIARTIGLPGAKRR